MELWVVLGSSHAIGTMDVDKGYPQQAPTLACSSSMELIYLDF